MSIVAGFEFNFQLFNCLFRLRALSPRLVGNVRKFTSASGSGPPKSRSNHSGKVDDSPARGACGLVPTDGATAAVYG